MTGSAAANTTSDSAPSSPTAAYATSRNRLSASSIAEIVARKARLSSAQASRYIAKKIDAIAPNIVPTTPESTPAAGRTADAGSGSRVPGCAISHIIQPA